MKVSVIGNCQSRPIAECLAMMLPKAAVTPGFSRDIRAGTVDLPTLVGEADLLVVQTCMRGHVAPLLDAQAKQHVIYAPTIFYSGFHPDIVYASVGGKTQVANPLGSSNSAIVLYGWLHGMNAEQIVGLFNEDVYADLGYFDYKRTADEYLLEDARQVGMDLAEELANWSRAGCFVHNANHPHMKVHAGISREVVRLAGIEPTSRYPEHVLMDKLSAGVVWPIYPEIGARLGVPGEYAFKRSQGKFSVMEPPGIIVGLEEFVVSSLEFYAKLDKETFICTRFEDERYAKLLDRGKGVGKAARKGHPYRGLPDRQFWNKSVAAVEPSTLDPVSHPRTVLAKDTLIATAGSCFAQHIARALQKSGYTYYVAETPDGLTPKEATERQYGVFSARYGNIYTATQLAQLIDRVNGVFKPADTAWRRADGRYVDPFRPQIEPAGFATAADVEVASAEHLAHVRRLFETLDVFIFTLGLTEAWRSKEDGAVFPIAPGVASGEMDFGRYEFHNNNVDETVIAMRYFIEQLRALNPRAKVMLTVSPVPLAATYEDKHVLVATTYSKSVLRVAAETLTQTLPDVEYFPSYEIITGAYNRGAYFEEDLRSISPDGVAHVMGRFLAHHTDATAASATPSPAAAPLALRRSREMEEGQEIICEEELLARV